MISGIFYLYEYKNGQKFRNAGFLKLVCRRGACCLLLHAKGIPVSKQDNVPFFAFYMEKQTLLAKNISTLPCGDSSLSARLNLPAFQFPSGRSFEDTDGFLISLPNKEWLATVLSDITPNFTQMEYVTEKQPTPAEESVPKPGAPETPAKVPSEKEQTGDVPGPTSDISTTSAPHEKASAPVLEHIDENSPTFQKTALPDFVRRIQRQDLSQLPKQYWYLANNSFLLHGYYNYKHLLLVHKDGHYWLGVPGIYDPREAHAAKLLGFPQFTDAYNTLGEPPLPPMDTDAQFGYWCRYLEAM